MTTPTSHRVLELRQQSRARRASADHLRTEQQLICEQTRRRLAESRRLLDGSAQRLTLTWAGTEPRPAAGVSAGA